MRAALTLCLATLPTLAHAEVPQVVTDIPPVHALVAQVMGDLGTPTLLLEKGADEHDFQLRPSQMQVIADANLAIWIGPELTPWLDRALQSTDTAIVSLPLLGLNGTQTQDFAVNDHEDGTHTEDAAHAEGAHEEDTHEDSGLDPHAWMNPANASLWLTAIAQNLAKADPANADIYTANAETARQRIQTLDTELAQQLRPLADKPFVTFHAAYGYFTTHYGLKTTSLALGDASAPGAAKLAELQSALQAGSYTCAFPEVQHDPALLTQLMQNTTTKLGPALDPVGSSLPFGPDAYGALMRNIATALTDCLNP
jgi:zinc transport system substrate-binding protein